MLSIVPPLALGGDGLAGDSAAIAAISLVSIAAGYALLAGLWYFVFRQKPEERERERELAARPQATSATPASAAELSSPAAPTPRADPHRARLPHPPRRRG